MARLSPRRSSLAADDRGQLLLIGAFGIAIFLLVFAGVVNTFTTTETLTASTGDHPQTRDVAALQADVTDGVGGILTRVNRGTGTYSTKVGRFDRSIGNWSDAAGRQYARDVTGVSVSLVDTDEGSRIAQSTNRSFTNASGVADWTLATTVPETGRFRLRLNRSALVAGACSSAPCYELVVDDGSDIWTLTVNQSAILVDGPTTSGQCAVHDDPVTVDLTAGTVDGRPCEDLQFAEGLSSPYALRYRNGANATGTYRLVVNASVADDGDYATTGSPSVSPAIYAATVELTVQDPQLRYANRLDIVRGETDG